MIRDLIFNQPYDTYIILLIMAIVMFIAILDALIWSIRQDLNDQKRREWETKNEIRAQKKKAAKIKVF